MSIPLSSKIDPASLSIIVENLALAFSAIFPHTLAISKLKRCSSLLIFLPVNKTPLRSINFYEPIYAMIDSIESLISAFCIKIISLCR